MKHKVKIANGNAYYGLHGEMFDEGEKIEFIYPFVTDASVRVTSKDVMSIKCEYQNNAYHYSFTMPDHDVDVSIGLVNDMCRNPNAYNENSFNQGPMTGFVGMRPRVNEIQTASIEAEAGPIKHYCPECGAKLKSSGQKFCTECGTGL